MAGGVAGGTVGEGKKIHVAGDGWSASLTPPTPHDAGREPKARGTKMANRVFKTIDRPPLVVFEEDHPVEGTFVGIEEKTTEHGPGKLATMEGEKVGRFCFFCPVILADLLSEVEVGSYVRITWTGTAPSKKKGYSATKLFKVEVAQ